MSDAARIESELRQCIAIARSNGATIAPGTRLFAGYSCGCAAGSVLFVADIRDIPWHTNRALPGLTPIETIGLLLGVEPDCVLDISEGFEDGATAANEWQQVGRRLRSALTVMG